MHGKDLEGRSVSVQFANNRKFRERRERPAPERAPPSKTLFIGNLSYEMTDQELNDLFSQTEHVLDVRVAMDRATGRPRGFAHADYLTQDAADKAINFLEHQSLAGRRLRVNYGTPNVTDGRRARKPFANRSQEGQNDAFSSSGEGFESKL